MVGRNTHKTSNETVKDRRERERDRDRDRDNKLGGGTSNATAELPLTSVTRDMPLAPDPVADKSLEQPGESETEEEEEDEYLDDEGDEEGIRAKLLQVEGVGRPLVWVRIRPTSYFDTELFEVGVDNKKLRIFVEPQDRLFPKKTGADSTFTFVSDGILQTTDQEEIFQKTSQELVEKAMDGTSGAVICVGPELSGKTFTLFGPLTKFQNRGLVPRTLEKIFDIIELKRNELEFHIILSMFEIHKDKIKDLLTLAPYELGRVGDFGPKGLFYEEITSAEHGLSLILRGLTGQGLIHTETYAKFHTIVYVDILATQTKKGDNGFGSTDELKEWRSRITFGKIGSIPLKETPTPSSRDSQSHDATGVGFVNHGPCPGPNCLEDQQIDRSRPRSRSLTSDKSKPKCCRGPTGELAEGIFMRKDIYFLEQMFIRSHELRKIHDYYNKLQSLGMYMLMRPPKLAPSQYFRQSKLTHCLKDIVSGNTIVRLILHVRPEKNYLQSTLEAMRFAARARCIPIEAGRKRDCVDDCLTFEERIANMCQEMGIPSPGQKVLTNVTEEGETNDEQNSPDMKISPEKLKDVLQQATAFFDDKLDSLEGACKDQVKSLFETFRETLTHVFDKDKENQVVAADPDDHDHDNEQDDQEANYYSDASDRRSVSSRKGRGVRPMSGKSNLKVNKRKQKQTSGGSKQGQSSNQSDTDKEEGAGNESDVNNVDATKKEKAGEISSGAISGADDDPGVSEAPSIVTEDGDIDKPSKERAKSIAFGAPRQSDASDSESRQFQKLCWNDFGKTENGTQLLEQFGEKQQLLRKVLEDHNEAQSELAVGMGKLTQLELQLDILEHDRKFNGNLLDEFGVPLVVSPQELQMRQDIHAVLQGEQTLMGKLKELRMKLQEQKCHLDSCKRDLEHVFQTFCMDTHGKQADLANLPLCTLDHAVSTTLKRWSRVHRLKSPPRSEAQDPLDLESMYGASEKEVQMARDFEHLLQLARQQVHTLLQAYPKRPPWISYC